MPAVRRIRQDVLRRHDHGRAGLGYPGIDVGIGAGHLPQADIEAPADVAERLALADFDDLQGTHDVLSGREHEALRLYREGRRRLGGRGFLGRGRRGALRRAQQRAGADGERQARREGDAERKKTSSSRDYGIPAVAPSTVGI